MLILQIKTETVLLKPVPFCYLEGCYFLMRLLPVHIGEIAMSDRHWANLQKLINMHPRGDINGFGFTLPEEYTLLPDIMEQLAELNKLNDLPELSKYAKKAPTPPISSGDRHSDLMADLIALYGADGALKITQTFGQDEINRLVFRSNQQQVPVEEREEIARKEYYDRFVDKNKSLVASLLGIPTAAIATE